MKDLYAIYFVWDDGFADSFNCKNAKERDLSIRQMLSRREFKSIEYSRLLANGEYGKRIKVL